MGINKEDTQVINKVKQPDNYKVIMLNDDKTSFDFVILVLMTIFHKNPKEANGIAMQIHTLGRGVAGVYCHEIAETKVFETEVSAKENGYPLTCVLEKEIK